MGMETYGYVVDQNGFNLSRLSSFLVSFHQLFTIINSSHFSLTDALACRSACKYLLIPLGTHKYLKRNLYADLTCASISSTFSSWLSPDTSFSYCSAALRTSSSSFSSSSIYTIWKIWNYCTSWINSPTHCGERCAEWKQYICWDFISSLHGWFI